VKRLLETFNVGRIIREGARISIVGKPNVGKSSLLNRLLNTERAIVSDIPGTTRDYLEEVIDILGIPFVVVDTAGLRNTADSLELAGMARTHEHISKSDIVLGIFDVSREPEEDDGKTLASLRNFSKENKGCHVVHVGNKSDVGFCVSWSAILSEPIWVSAKTGSGIEVLKNHIFGYFAGGISFESPMISRIRHKIALEKCRTSNALATNTVTSGKSLEFAAIDIRNSIDSLGEIVGEVTSNDILNAIFSKFCIGK
jgi:tRNA modification GTPase